MNPLVSIIVSVYNTEQYLSRCIDSVLGQSLTVFELLLVDDGSIDGSGAICDAYAEKDNRVRVFHKENGGVSSARNTGLDNAQGEWAAFVDSDDILPQDALWRLIQLVDDETDMAFGSIRKFDNDNDDLETIDAGEKRTMTIEECLAGFVAPKIWKGDWQRYLFNRLYRLSIINGFGLRFRNDIYYKEDGLFVVQYLCRCKNKVVCVPDIVYLYRQTNNSAMGSLATKYNDRLLTNVDAHGMIFRELKKFGVEKELLVRELKHLFQNYDWIMGIMKSSNDNTLKNRRLLRNRIIKNGGFANYLYYRVLIRY